MLQWRRLATRGVMALAVAGSVHAAAAKVMTLRYGQAYSAAHSIFSLPISVAEREGFFRREGLKVQVVIPVPGGTDRMVKALYDNWFDVTHIATPFLIRSVMAGSDAAAIDAEFDNPIYSLVAKPGIRTYADLRGRLIALANKAGSIAITTRKLLAKHGLGSGSYQVEVEAGTPQRFYCLLHGNCDAVVIGQPQDLEAIAKGYRLLGRTDEVELKFVYTVTAVRRSWAKAHREALTRFVRGMAGSFKFIHDPANRGRVIKVIADTTGCSKGIAGQTLDLFLQPGRDVLPDRGEIDVEGMRQVIAMMAGAGLLKSPLPRAQRFIDLQFLHAAGVE